MRCIETAYDDLNISEITASLKCINAVSDRFIFLDIETTGFSAKSSVCYLVGLGFIDDGVFKCIQFFADTPDDEGEILINTLSCIDEGCTLVTFNGTTFDIPFLQTRCLRLNIDCGVLSACTHTDVYTYAKRLNGLLGLDSLKQKSIEKFLGFDREDLYSGGELIEKYREYIISFKLKDAEKSGALLHMLMLHNREDVVYLAKICEILKYAALFFVSGNQACVIPSPSGAVQTLSAPSDCSGSLISSASSDGTESLISSVLSDGAESPKLLVYRFKADFSFPKNISRAANGVQLILEGENVIFKIPVIQGRLKHFYKDYKNYFYLPDEDRAIHKSVASYVDAGNRIKATAETCFTPVYGEFIPYFDETRFPCLRENRSDKSFYIKFDEAVCLDEGFAKEYAADIVAALIM